MRKKFFVSTEGDSIDQALDFAKEDSVDMDYEWTLYYRYDIIVVEVPSGEPPQNFAEDLLEKDNRFDVSVGCIKLGKNRYLFFGAYEEE